jgi:four helix bundle protein
MSSQLRRAASSVPLNLAEGNTKRSHPDKIRYIDTAAGSLEELHCAVSLSRDLAYVSEREFTTRLDQRIHRVSYLLSKLRASLSV